MSTPGMKDQRGQLREAVQWFNNTQHRTRTLTSTVAAKFINNTRKDNQPSQAFYNEKNSSKTLSGDMICLQGWKGQDS